MLIQAHDLRVAVRRDCLRQTKLKPVHDDLMRVRGSWGHLQVVAVARRSPLERINLAIVFGV